MEKKMDLLEQEATQNLNLSKKQLEKFLKQAKALRQNLLLRKKQQKEKVQKNGCIQN